MIKLILVHIILQLIHIRVKLLAYLFYNICLTHVF